MEQLKRKTWRLSWGAMQGNAIGYSEVYELMTSVASAFNWTS
jgi:hypothetical protein